MSALLWLRRDLRRSDHPALLAALDAADGQLAVAFVIDPTLWDHAGPVRRAWLAASVEALRSSYDDKLVLLHGNPAKRVPELARSIAATSVHVSSECTPSGRRRDRAVAAALRSAGIDLVATGSPYAVGPGLVRNQDGRPYQVFTPFARAWREQAHIAPAITPAQLPLLDVASDPTALKALREALADPDAPRLPAAGEEAGLARWRTFVNEAVEDYADNRNRPDLDATSVLSPYLKVGAIHPRTLLADLQHHRADTFVSELAWREFYADVLFHHPASAWNDLKPALRSMEYDAPGASFEAWRNGQTGYPIVDAGMRQLSATGWMHNRVRMITASFLTKDLHVWWPHGARHFLNHLIDGDLASNSHGWQWTAGTGTDASPYFRVFNPITQGIRFDPNGDYVRRWVPELRHLAGKAAHEPWKHAAGHKHGYPEPIVDHSEERKEALRRYDLARSATQNR